MNNDKQSFESIKSKLRKLQALAEQGYKGEAEAAKRLPHPQMEQLTSPRKYPLPRQVSARVAQGASTVEGKRLGGKSETRTKIIQTKNQSTVR